MSQWIPAIDQKTSCISGRAQKEKERGWKPGVWTFRNHVNDQPRQTSPGEIRAHCREGNRGMECRDKEPDSQNGYLDCHEEQESVLKLAC